VSTRSARSAHPPTTCRWGGFPGCSRWRAGYRRSRSPPRWPTRFWARCTIPLPETPLVQACALTYLSDISSGLLAWDGEEAATGPSLDHALWFHRPARMDEWVLVDLAPRTVAGGRGWYDGGIYTADGTRAVTIAQEALFRFGKRPPGWNG